MSKPINKLLLPFNPYTLDSLRNDGDTETQEGEINADIAATQLKLQRELLMLLDRLSSRLTKPINADLCLSSTSGGNLVLSQEHVQDIQAEPTGRESATRAFAAKMRAQLIPADADCSLDPIAVATRKDEHLLVQLLCMPPPRPKL